MIMKQTHFVAGYALLAKTATDDLLYGASPMWLRLPLNKMLRSLIPTLTDAQRELVIAQGRSGAIPQGLDIDLAARTRQGLSDPQRWDTYKKGFHSLKAKIR